ncbi:MAG: hypothetical protein RLZZ214_3072 [Verrucomicrobiota bacterium]
MNLIAKKHTYGADASSPPVRVNGADIRMQVKPEGTDGANFAFSAMVVSAAVATLDGPFRWRIEATGEIGKQDYLVVHRIRTRTAKTRRDEWYPAALLGKKADFKRPRGATGATRAVYPIPGRLEVKPRVDGALEVFVDLTVVTAGRRERKLVKFRMDPSQTRQDEFIFVPTEIISSFGKSPADWDDAGWD